MSMCHCGHGSARHAGVLGEPLRFCFECGEEQCARYRPRATTAYGRLARIVRDWSEVNGGELNRVQVREILRALDHLHEAEEVVQAWAERSPS